IYQVRDLLPAHLLAHLHLWTDEAVEKRYLYRAPGVEVLTVRVWKAPQIYEIAGLPAYQGCKSWVLLDDPIDTAGSVPVLSDREDQDVVSQVRTLLRPTARV